MYFERGNGKYPTTVGVVKKEVVGTLQRAKLRGDSITEMYYPKRMATICISNLGRPAGEVQRAETTYNKHFSKYLSNLRLRADRRKSVDQRDKI